LIHSRLQKKNQIAKYSSPIQYLPEQHI